MSRHVMVEREFGGTPERRMTQDESGLVSADVWADMVKALRTEDIRDRYGWPWARSRGRHHAEETCRHTMARTITGLDPRRCPVCWGIRP